MLPDFYEAKKAHEVAKFQFIVIELDLAITFALTAQSSSSSEKFERNLEHARQAYTSASKLLKDADLSAEMGAQVRAKVARLQHLLEQLNHTGEENPAAIPSTINIDELPAKDE